jgi:hypothetical protein
VVSATLAWNGVVAPAAERGKVTALETESDDRIGKGSLKASGMWLRTLEETRRPLSSVRFTEWSSPCVMRLIRAVGQHRC